MEAVRAAARQEPVRRVVAARVVRDRPVAPECVAAVAPERNVVERQAVRSVAVLRGNVVVRRASAAERPGWNGAVATGMAAWSRVNARVPAEGRTPAGQIVTARPIVTARLNAMISRTGASAWSEAARPIAT
ncbi:hypothetical protein OICFNHDK_0605 [Methylobacterium bullatum]|uniref:Uncharacterized protein n=1 Tax=Methylobacterium bullatum TaxID=570505 RepID=A0AAV4Z2D3_9HYPH|nr:hypothetical protein OICFNHDK_0605 [Methylobacterium bullatum]